MSFLASLSLLLAATGRAAMPDTARTFHVHATAGNDANDGLTPASPWQTLAKVNAARLKPGNTVRFCRGETWRGQLVPRSGDATAPITYTAYGDGPKPLLLGSESRNEPGDWHHEGGNIWATLPMRVIRGALVKDTARSAWSTHHEAGAKVETTREQGGVHRLACSHSGTRSNHIQFSVADFAVEAGKAYELVFRARCTRPFTVARIALMKRDRPWTSYGSSRQASAQIADAWRDHATRFQATHTADDARITLFLGGALPAGATLSFEPRELREVQCNQRRPLDVDVGNIIFDHGAATGVKKWRPDDLEQQGDYWYDAAHWQVRLCSKGNPAERFRSIELALRRHIINEGGRHHVTYQDLALRYGAAHGIGGGETDHITVRRCDLSYIGGGHQLTRPGGRPVRYGNAIEFWNGARHNLVEGCRIWEVYDAALTNQGNGPGNVQERITYRHNVIWNCEYSFEYWNRDQTSRTEHIVFEHNTCVDAGRGWAHGQRPDPNGRHLMFYTNTAQTTDFVVRDNIFANATESCLRLGSPDWSKGIVMDRNCWWQAKGTLILWLREPFAPDRFAAYRQKTGLDAGSILAAPRFVDAAARDYRLAPDSPGRTLAADGGPVGARPTGR